MSARLSRWAWAWSLAICAAGCVPSGGGSGADADDDDRRDGAVSADQGPSEPAACALDFDAQPDPAIPLSVSVVSATWIGGAGDQFVRSIEFDAGGAVIARGAGFEARFDGGWRIDGDPATHDDAAWRPRPPLPGNPGTLCSHGASGLDFRVGYRQAGNVQLPIFRAFVGEMRQWTLWGHAVADVQDRNLGADSRCYRAWGMPGDLIGVQCWTDGGNSVLAKDPRDLDRVGFTPSWSRENYQRSAGGMASLYALVDPRDGGAVVSGTFVAAHVAPLAVDLFGRVYLAGALSSRDGGPLSEADDALGFGGRGGGLAVLDESLSAVLFNTAIGGTGCGEDGRQGFGAIAIRGGRLALGGTTCAAELATTLPAQAGPGGGQDGFVVILDLW